MELGLSANWIGAQRGWDWGLARMGLGLSANSSTGGSNRYDAVYGSPFRPAAE